MDFQLSKMHLLQQELYRKFAETEIKAAGEGHGRGRGLFPGLLEKMQKYGFFGIPYSKEYGGVGADTLAYTLCMEEVSKVDASTGITISVHTSLCCSCINEFGTEEQKQKYLRPLVDGSKIGCYGLTEPGAGSDVQGAQTVAVEDGDDYVITGSKVFTTNSGFADTCVLFALTDRSVPAAKGMTAFIVDLKEMPGITVSENIERIRYPCCQQLHRDLRQGPRTQGAGSGQGRRRLQDRHEGAGCRPYRHCRSGRGHRPGRFERGHSVWQKSASSSARPSTPSRTPSSRWPSCRPRSTLLAC